MLQTFQDGLSIMESNSRLILVACLLVVFPLLFVLITQSFFETAHTNINTARKQQIHQLHNTVSFLAADVAGLNSAQLFVGGVIKKQSDITNFQIVTEKENQLEIVAALDDKQIGEIIENTEIYNTALTRPDTSFIFEYYVDGVRVWQAFRYISESDAYVFSEHSFEQSDAVLLARQQQSYLGLSLIFVFLIVLAYWISKQMNWRRENDRLVKNMHDHSLFTNMLAHELRAPLTAMKGYASMLEESSVIQREDKQYAMSIKKSADRLITLVNDFLEVAKVQSGKLRYHFEDTDLNTIVAQAIEEQNTIAKHKNLTLTAEVPANSVLYTDRKRLIQVLSNLVNNAIKYTETGSVAVSVSQTVHRTTIRIKDTGIGISAEEREKLFAPFSRVGGVEQKNVTGSGLGMWITKQIIEQLHGTVSVESIKDVGTHIIVSFKH